MGLVSHFLGYTMAKDPAFLLYSSDFLTGTVFMSNEDVGVYMRLLCAQHQHGGHINKAVFEATTREHPAVVAKFVETTDGYHNHRLMSEMVKRAKKSSNLSENAKKRWAAKTPCNCIANASDLHMPIEDEDEDVNRDDIKAVISHLNKVYDSRFLPTAYDTARKISGRLADGFTVEDMCRVIDYKVEEWADTEWAQYLRPKTLFSQANFEGYLSAATKHSAEPGLI